MNAARRAREELEAWPDLHSAPASCGTGTALCAGAVEIVHFHSDHLADLHLSRLAIERLSMELGRSTAVRLHPSSVWITVLLDGDSDADLLVTLASFALQTHSRRGVLAPGTLCNLGYVSILKDGQEVTATEPPLLSARSLVPKFSRKRGSEQGRQTA